MKYGVTKTNQNIHSDYSNKEQSGDNKSSSKEDVKEEEEDKSEFDESDHSIKGLHKKEMIIMPNIIFHYSEKKLKGSEMILKFE